MVIQIFVTVLFMVYGVALVAFPRGFAVRMLHYFRGGNLTAGMAAWFRRACGVLFIAVGIGALILGFLRPA
jgi:hypothetical protein